MSVCRPMYFRLHSWEPVWPTAAKISTHAQRRQVPPTTIRRYWVIHDFLSCGQRQILLGCTSYINTLIHLCIMYFHGFTSWQKFDSSLEHCKVTNLVLCSGQVKVKLDKIKEYNFDEQCPKFQIGSHKGSIVSREREGERRPGDMAVLDAGFAPPWLHLVPPLRVVPL